MSNRYIKMMTVAFHKPYDISIEGNRQLERERRIALTAITSILLKIISTAIPLITLKITYLYLGVEVYGLWSTITNFFALFAFSDLGLGNGLQTKLSYASGKDDTCLARELISSTYLVLWIVAAILLVVFGALYPFIDWASAMNAQDAESIALAAPIVFVIVLPRIFTIPITIISRTQLALQEGYNSNLWSLLGSILSLVYIYLGAHFDIGKIQLLLGSAVIPLTISILNMIVYYGIQRPELRFSLKEATKKTVKELLKIGIAFCLLSILTTVGMSMDTFIVAKTCSLADAGSFSIIYKISIIISAVLGIFAQPLWGANGEAIARGDFEWVKRNTKRMSILMTAITLIGTLLVMCLAKPVFSLWLGPDFEFSMICLLWLCLLQVAQAYISPYFMILNALGMVKPQILMFLIYTPIAFLLKFSLAKFIGVSAIPAVGTLLYIFIVIYTLYVSHKSLLKIK